MPSPAAVVLVNFQCADLVARIASDAIADNHRVVVTDNSGEYQGPGEVVRPGRNLGFGVGCNVAAATLDDETWVTLVNPDIVLDRTHTGGVLNALTSSADQVGLDVASPTLRTGHGLIRRGYHRPQLSRELVFAAKMLRSPVGGNGASVSNAGWRPPRLVRGPRFGSGALLAIRLETWRAVGGFDDRFVLYGEDLDFWCRAERSGAAVGFVESIEVDHGQGQGSPTPRIDRDVLRWAGIQLFVQLHEGSHWRSYRRIHGAVLARLVDQSDSAVAHLVHDAWIRKADPVATGLQLRAAFADGLMGRPSSPAVA